MCLIYFLGGLTIKKDQIDSLVFKQDKVLEQISSEESIPFKSVSSTVRLLHEDNTIPFISRYRKEMTGSLDEVQIRDIAGRFKYLEILETRKIEVIKIIFEQGKLTDALLDNIQKASTQSELEGLYAPYKKKKKTHVEK